MDKEIVAQEGVIIEPNKEKELASIHYQKIDGDIVIVGFNNFMGSDDIRRKHGDMAYSIYSSNYPHVIGNAGRNAIEVDGEWYKIGDMFDRKSFGLFISHLKDCGKALNVAINLARKVAESVEVKEVTI